MFWRCLHIIACSSTSFLFFMLSNNTLYDYTTLSLFISGWACELFPLLGYHGECHCEHLCTGICMDIVSSFLLGGCLGKELMGHAVNVCLTFWRTYNCCFLKWLHHLTLASPYLWGIHSKTPQWRPEIMDSAKPNVCTMLFSQFIYTFSLKRSTFGHLFGLSELPALLLLCSGAHY